MTIQASGEPGLVRPLKEAVEESVKKQIDRSYQAEKPSANRQTVGHEGNVPTRDETITKISSAGFYQDVGKSVISILEKRAAKGVNKALLPEILRKKKKILEEKDEKEEGKEKNGKKNVLPPFMKTKGEKEEDVEGGEEEEEGEGEEKPAKGKKKAEKKEDEEEPKFPIFGKKPRKAQ